MNFWSPQLHFILTAIHIFATVFWLGWMVFIFFILRPVASRVAEVDVVAFMIPIRRRVRKVVFWLIPVILLTGLYNMGYRGLLDGQMLFNTSVGARMLWKLGAAGLLFGIYYFAPFAMGGKLCNDDPAGGHKPNPKVKKVEVVMHLAAFSAGCVAAYLGITIGG